MPSDASYHSFPSPPNTSKIDKMWNDGNVRKVYRKLPLLGVLLYNKPPGFKNIVLKNLSCAQRIHLILSDYNMMDENG